MEKIKPKNEYKITYKIIGCTDLLSLDVVHINDQEARKQFRRLFPDYNIIKIEKITK